MTQGHRTQVDDAHAAKMRMAKNKIAKAAKYLPPYPPKAKPPRIASEMKKDKSECPP